MRKKGRKTMTTTTQTKQLFSHALQAGYKAIADEAITTAEGSDAVDLFAATAALEAWFTAHEEDKIHTRAMRRSRKVIDTLTAGVYGGWVLRWKPSARMVPDLASIAATYERLGLGEVPMKLCADSLEVEKA
jgi:hypothetical protein